MPITTPTPATIWTEDGLHQVNSDGFGTTFIGEDPAPRGYGSLMPLYGRVRFGRENSPEFKEAVADANARIERAFGRKADASASGRAA